MRGWERQKILPGLVSAARGDAPQRSAEQLDQRDCQPDDAGRHEPQLPIQPCLQAADVALDRTDLGPDQTYVGLQFGPNVDNLGPPLGNLGSEGGLGLLISVRSAVSDSLMSALIATSDASMLALVAALPVMASPIVSTRVSASASAAQASQRAFTARWVSKASELMDATVWRETPVRQRWRRGKRCGARVRSVGSPRPRPTSFHWAQSSSLNSLSVRGLEFAMS